MFRQVVVITAYLSMLVIAMFLRLGVAHSRDFTVRDSIELLKVVPPRSILGSAAASPAAMFSPDGRRFLIETRRGDVAANVVLDQLLMFNTADVRGWLSQGTDHSTPPPAAEIASIAATDEQSEISNIQWIDSDTVGFIAKKGVDRNQVFEVKVSDHSIRQLTNASTNVSRFAASGGEIVYFSTDIAPLRDAESVNDHLPSELIDHDGHYWTSFFPTLNLYTASTNARTNPSEVHRPEVPTMRVRQDFQRIWIAPSGRTAIVLVPAVNAPPAWSRYRIRDYEFFGYMPDRHVSDPSSTGVQFRLRFALLDTATGKLSMLLNAPAAITANVPLNVFWTTAEKSVVVSGTYRPLSDKVSNDSAELDPAIVEVDAESLKVTPITPIQQHSEVATVCNSTLQVSEVNFESSQGVVELVEEPAPCGSLTVGEQTRRVARYWSKTSSGWSETPKSSAFDRPLAIELRQDLNLPPTVVAHDGVCGCEGVLLRTIAADTQRSMGSWRVITWTDRDGIAWKGGLLTPVHYQPTRAYPVVLQTHGFDPHEYLTDGPFGATTGFAAQALAGAGFVVLQVEENPKASTDDVNEAYLYAEGLRAAVDTLVTSGIAQAGHVGIIAWSRTGIHVVRAVADNPKLFAAATIADTGQGGYMSNLFFVNQSADARAQYSKLYGQPPDFTDMNSWFAGHAMYRLREANVPLRIEAIGPSSLIAAWEPFAVLRLARKPVDYVYFPFGSHSLFKPDERMESQGGNVDWFRFWLQDQQDDDPAKAAQYSRWRAMRAQSRRE